MPFYIFAGPIFTDTQWYSILIGGFLVFSLLLALGIYGFAKLLHKNKTLKSNTTLIKSIVISVGLIGSIILVVFVAPTVFTDNRWENKQSECAIKAGYSNPAENESNIATAASQSTYRECLKSN